MKPMEYLSHLLTTSSIALQKNTQPKIDWVII